jgi:hypothetical protein
MSRSFAAASSQYLQNGNAPVTAPPFTMACWFKQNTLAAEQGLVEVYNSGANNQHRHILALDQAGSVAHIKALSFSTVGATASCAANVSTGTWYHAAGVWAATNSRSAYHNGGSKDTNGGNITPTGINAVAVGGFIDTAPDRYMDGLIADAAIWNVALTDAEVAVLASGVSPLAVRPAALVAYWPLWGVHSPEIDLKGGFALTLNNGPTKGEHPRVRYLAQSPLRNAEAGAPPPAGPESNVFAIAS